MRIKVIIHDGIVTEVLSDGLAERCYNQHSEMTPSQGHVGHIDAVFIHDS